jgi:hypothetical protein
MAYVLPCLRSADAVVRRRRLGQFLQNGRKIRPQAEGHEKLGEHIHGADQHLNGIVEQSWAFALEQLMSNDLQRPTKNK